MKSTFLLILAFAMIFSSCRKISCESCDSSGNKPPIANAGPDRLFMHLQDTFMLDGSASIDPDGSIVSFSWSGHGMIENPNSARTKVNIPPSPSLYKYVLKVVDNHGAVDYDTVNVDLVVFNRPVINAQLVQVGTLNPARLWISIAAIGDEILFAGGRSGSISHSEVDIYNVSTNSWTQAQLSEARHSIASAVSGDKAFFGGGFKTNSGASNSVDVFDASSNTWSTTQLTHARAMMSAGTVGNKVFFAGGYNWGNFSSDSYPTVVETFDIINETWSETTLSSRLPDASLGISTTVIDNKIYFAGAAGDFPGWDFGDHSSTINIFNASTNSWSTSQLSQAKGFMASVAFGNKIYYAGGKNIHQPPYVYLTNEVEIVDVITGTTEYRYLSQPGAGFFTNYQAVVQNNKIIFFSTLVGNRTIFDIYNTITGEWSIGLLNAKIEYASIICLNNNIYIAGFHENGTLSDRVYKLVF